MAKLDIKTIKDSIEVFNKKRSPDISGGYEVMDDHVYFKDADGITSVVISLEAWKDLKRRVRERLDK